MRTRIISLCLALGIAATSWAQKQTVTGSVVDADGEPVIGAVVKTQDGKVAGVTDVNGAFTLSVPQGKTTLVISSVGLKTQMVSATAGKPLSVKMANDEKTLDELVVVGYGIQKKSALTGSIETIKAEDLTMQPGSRFAGDASQWRPQHGARSQHPCARYQRCSAAGYRRRSTLRHYHIRR